MNTNQKGVKGLIKVIDDLQERGFYTFPAFDDHSPVDLIAMSSDGKTYRLQVKYKTRQSHKKKIRYELVAASVINGKKILINRDLIDGWAVYLEEHKKVVYVNKEQFNNKYCMILTGEETDAIENWKVAGEA